MSTTTPAPEVRFRRMSPGEVADLAQRLAESGVEPGATYCGATGCLHPGSQHSSMGNRCLVCGCSGFTSRLRYEDIAVALRIALDGMGR